MGGPGQLLVVLGFGLHLALPLRSFILGGGKEGGEVDGQDFGIERELVRRGPHPILCAGGISQEKPRVDKIAPESDMVDPEISANLEGPSLELSV